MDRSELSRARAAITRLVVCVKKSGVSGKLICKRTAERSFGRDFQVRDEESPAGDTTGPVQRTPRRSASAQEAPVEGALRRASVPEQAPRDASLGVEVTPRDTGFHDRLPARGKQEGRHRFRER